MRRWVVLPVFVLSATHAAAQTGTGGRVVGTVTADNGQPVVGANVVVLGTGRGAVTTNTGAYTITAVPAGAQQVQARRIGYAPITQSVAVVAGQSATSNFRLAAQATQLQGVVAVGYGTQERQRVTGAVATVQAQQLQEVPTSNPIQALQGRVAGVEVVSSSNLPGSGFNIQIRGIRSLGANNSPLYVVDGIPLSGGVQDFNPADVANISILKDASATAVYGARGANGVVLITTKGAASRGVTRPQFNFDTYYGSQRPRRLVQMMNAQQYVQYLRDAAAYAGVDTSLARILTPIRLYDYQHGITTDWQRALLQTGQQRNYQLGLNGSTGTTRYSLSGNWFGQDGLTSGQDYKRGAGTASLDQTLGRVRLGITATGSRSTQDVGYGDALWGNALGMTPFGVPRDSAGNLIARPDDEPLQVNPIANQQNYVRQIARTRVFASAYGQVQLLPGLSYRANFGPDITNSSDGSFAGSVTNDRNLGTSRAAYFTGETTAYTFDNLLTYTRDLGDVHHFDFTGLYSIQHQRSTMDSAAATALPYDQQLWYNIGSGTIQGQGSRLSEFNINSWMGRVNYSLLNRYTVSLTGRYDGSSVLAPGHKWSFFPSVGLAWVAGDEELVRRFLPVFSALKFRASSGTVGNSSVNPYQTEGSLGITAYNYGSNSANGYRPSVIPNPDLRWEKTSKKDLGMEFGVLNNRITGTADFYLEDTKDVLLPRALPGTAGYGQVLQNIGATRNAGVEYSVSTINLRNWHGLAWSTDLNWAHNHNEIRSLANGVTADVGNLWFVGQPINAGGSSNSDAQRRVFYDYKFLGIWQTQDSALARKYGFKPGQVRVADLNGDGKIDANDRTIVGNTYARWTASVYNRFTFKQVDLSGLLTAKIGYTLFDDFTNNTNSLQGRYGNIVSNYWTPTNPSNTDPAPGYNGSTPIYAGTRSYQNGSHWRVRNVTLGYTLSDQIARRVSATRLRVYTTAQDPFVFTSYKGYDPENGSYGGSPAYRTVLVGANVGF